LTFVVLAALAGKPTPAAIVTPAAPSATNWGHLRTRNFIKTRFLYYF
jgi:hypothetical protein